MSEIHSKYVPGTGNIAAQLMIVQDCPSASDAASGKQFTGPVGKQLDMLLKEVGISRSEVWLTSVSKYHVRPQRKKEKISFIGRAEECNIDLNKQAAELQLEINELKPNCILSLGKWALHSFTGKSNIQQMRGSILMGMGRKMVPTYHPDNLLWNSSYNEFIGYYNRVVMGLDFRRAINQSRFPEINRPKRILEVCKNSADLQRFLYEYRNHPKLSADIESGGHCLPICIGLSFNKLHGMTVPLWNCDGLSQISDSDMATIWRVLAEVLDAKKIIGQNFNYDRDKLRRLGFRVSQLHSDVMLKTFALNPELPKGLAFNTSIYTEEPFYKDEGMYEGKLEDLYTGCARDACVTFEIDEITESEVAEFGVKDFYYNFLMKLPDFYMEIENNGFTINQATRERLLRRYIEWDERLAYELYQIVGLEVNVGSPKQVKSLLFDAWKLPRRDGTSEEELTALLNLKNGVKDQYHRRAIEIILEKRRVRKTISTYLMAIPDYDGRMKTTCFPCLDTGRSSTGMQDPPTRPLVDIVGKGRKTDMKSMGIAFQTMTKHGDIGADVREMYEPYSG